MPPRHGRRSSLSAGRRCNDVDLMRTPSSNSKLISGAAIMLALWALFLLSALVISWALDIDSRLSLSGDGARMLKAEAVACSGAQAGFAKSERRIGQRRNLPSATHRRGRSFELELACCRRSPGSFGNFAEISGA